MSLIPLPNSPQESVPLAHIFFLTGHEYSGPLPAELKLRENTVSDIVR